MTSTNIYFNPIENKNITLPLDLKFRFFLNNSFEIKGINRKHEGFPHSFFFFLASLILMYIY
jgi:hypothetical protein